MTTLAVGCPVAHREWILPRWFDHVEIACEAAGVSPTYVFVGDVEDPSMSVVAARAEDVLIEHVPNSRGTDTRDWSRPQRYEELVDLRNRLLTLVRKVAPDYFLSLDSDILAHPALVKMLIDDLTTGSYAAMGGKCYMTATGRSYPSWANLGREGQLLRSDTEGRFPVQVIMAIKLMTSEAYHVDYEFHVQGEDIGWSLACGRQRVWLGWDGRVASKHVLAPHLLDRVDLRVGF